MGSWCFSMLLKDDKFAKYLAANGIPVTRENYIDLAWGANPPEWNAELEAELPQELQNWSLFKEINGELIYQPPKGT